MKFTRFGVVIVALLLALLTSCKPSRDFSGDWVGTLDAGHLKVRLVFHLKRSGSGYEGTVDSVDQGRRDLPVNLVKAKGSEVHFELGAFGAVYDGKVDSTGTQMTGLFRQGGLNLPFTLKKTAQPPTIAPPLQPAAYTPKAGSPLQGYWQGTVTIGPVNMRLAFKIADVGKGHYRAELDSLDQGATGVPVTSISYAAPAVHMDVIGVAGVFDGTLTNNSEISGTWKQGPNALPVVFKRTSPPASDTADYRRGNDAEPQGTWNGALDAKTAVLHLVLKIGKASDGSFVAKLDSPDQGANDIAATDVQFTAPNLQVQWKGLQASFQGELKNNKLTGTWKQNALALPLTFERDKSK